MSDSSDVLAKYVRRGVLRQIPARLQARLTVLEWLAEPFEAGRTYTEPEVNAMLDSHEIDFATLRRLLIDYGFLQREHSVYWRVSAPGGPEN